MKSVVRKILSVTLAVSVVLTCFTATAFAAETSVGVSYSAHVQDIGWQAAVSDGATAGTTGQGKRIEALKVNLTHAPQGAHINYQVHVQDHGWMAVASDGTVAGTTGENKRIEAVAMTVSGVTGYTVEYRVHVQDIGWMNWVSGGSVAGTVGQSKRIEAIQIRLASASISSFSITPQLVLTIGKENGTIAATGVPANEIKNISWSSDNTAAATVSNGVVTAVAVGRATVTASIGGKTATCLIIVISDEDDAKKASTVTFTETNSLAGANIRILDDYDSSFYRSITTGANGTASINLPDGEYWFEINAAGHIALQDSIVVSGAAVQYNFTMVDQGQDYTVTFAESSSLAGVGIQVYNSSSGFISTASTDSSGIATIDLPAGSYKLGANAAGHDTLVSSFTVGSAPQTVNFTMVQSVPVMIPYYENFDSSVLDGTPSGWRTNYPSNWVVSDSHYAGGSSRELTLNYYPWLEDNFAAMTPAINASGSQGLYLTFKQYLNHYDAPYTLQVQVSTDGGATWATVWSVSPTANIGPQTVNIDLSAYDGKTINVAWVLKGNSYNINNWYIDDVRVTDNQPV